MKQIGQLLDLNAWRVPFLELGPNFGLLLFFLGGNQQETTQTLKNKLDLNVTCVGNQQENHPCWRFPDCETMPCSGNYWSQWVCGVLETDYGYGHRSKPLVSNVTIHEQQTKLPGSVIVCLFGYYILRLIVLGTTSILEVPRF